MNVPILIIVILLFPITFTWLCWFILTSNLRARRSSSKLPPGPYRFPIIGNILDLGPLPHRSLAKLSRKYGPVISLQLGTITTVVVSSPDTAKIVLQKHDAVLSNRTVPSIASTFKQRDMSVTWLPIGDKHRRLRKICKEHLFSGSRLDATQDVRREQLQRLHIYLSERCQTGRAVDIAEAAFTTTLNLVSATLFSVEFTTFDSDSSLEIMGLLRALLKYLSGTNLTDFFPVLGFGDLLGKRKQTAIYLDKMFEIFDEKLKSSNHLMEMMINLNKRRGEPEFTRDQLNTLLLDLFLAGSDTSSLTVEWAMTELIRHPMKMSRLRNEIKSFLDENGQVRELDISSMPYLQAVVKETLRLHPVGPLLVPHKADCDVEINGYIVPKNAQVLVNIWAIGRDSSIWAHADEFVPERFLNENYRVDFRGQDFEFIPFGTGRRICPGLSLASRMVPQMLVTFVGNFEWKPLEENEMDMDMNEKFQITLRKAVPLKAIPKKL